MLLNHCHFMLYSTVISVLCWTTVATSEPTQLIIPLNKAITYGDKQLYSNFLYLNNATKIQLGFENVNPNISFIIIQVHTYLYNVTLYKNFNTPGSKAYGSNIGMHADVKEILKDNFYILNSNIDLNLKMFITVHGYWTGDPIPGGCSLENMPIVPYLSTSYNKDYIFIDGAPSKYVRDINCLELHMLNIQFYAMYMPERNFDSDTYFDSIQSMLTKENIVNNGRVIAQTSWAMRRMVSAYPGTGTVYVAIVTAKKMNDTDNTTNSPYAVYVPTQTYGCSPLLDDCDLLDDILSRFMCASLLFIGLFLCYFGHRFFKTEMFLIGLVSGVIITYIVISLNAELDRPALIAVSSLSGLFFGAIWLLFWWFYGLPVFSVLLSSMNLGFMLASIIYYRLPGEFKYLQEDLFFWSLFIMIILLSSVMLVSMTFIANIQCCAILGAYAALYPIDYYLGSNLKYILINTIRRAIVPNFNNAVIMPFFQWKDFLVTLAWVLLATTGFLVQFFRNRNRPPFPPPPRNVRPSMVDTPSFYGATFAPTRVIRRPAQNASSPNTPTWIGERTSLLG